MNTYRGEEIWLHTFLTSALEEGKQSAQSLRIFNPCEMLLVLLDRRSDKYQIHFEEKNLPI
jgi:hypothetical protein